MERSDEEKARRRDLIRRLKALPPESRKKVLHLAMIRLQLAKVRAEILILRAKAR